VNHTAIDPYTADGRYFECLDCGARETGDRGGQRCRVCDGRLRNIAVPRE
jgi:hypothetical protein